MALKETFKALSDPVRRDILELLKAGSMRAGDIAAQFQLGQATISYHLSLLKQAGLIRERRNYIYYELNASVFEELLLWAKGFAPEEKEAVQDEESR